MAKNREVHVANYNVALSCVFAIREIKFDVTWSYVKRQTAKMTSEFLFFSSHPSLNHVKIENCLLLFATVVYLLEPEPEVNSSNVTYDILWDVRVGNSMWSKRWTRGLKLVVVIVDTV